MKIAYVLAVCNGDHFLEQWIKSRLIFSSEAEFVFCIAEGATEKWMKANNFTDTRSTDKTYDILQNYSLCFDNFMVYQQFSPYKDKNAQYNAALKLVPDDTDYIWISGADEIYHTRDILKMIRLLEDKKPNIVYGKAYHFWKYGNIICKGGDGWGYDTEFQTIFKWQPKSYFSNHRPITMVNDMFDPIDYKKRVERAEPYDIMCYHYSYMNDRQVLEKLKYYQLVYPYIDYMSWFNNVWRVWKPENHKEIEAAYSVHPSVPNAKTLIVDLKHPTYLPDLLNAENYIL